LAYLAKWALRAVFLLGVMVALASQAKAAPVVFEVSAEADDGWALSGTVTIDTATGKVLSADLAATDGYYGFGFDVVDKVQRISAARGVVFTEMWFGGGQFSQAELLLTVQEPTLVGYKGSRLYEGVDPPVTPGSCIVFAGGGSHDGGADISLYGALEPK